MDWLTAGLAATLLFAFIGLADKVVISRYFKNPWGYPFYTALFLSVYSLMILLGRLVTNTYSFPSPAETLLALAPGLVHFLAATLFARALLDADAATVFGLSQISPVFALLWGALFFADVFLPANYLGVGAIVVCSLLLGWELAPGKSRRRRMSRAVGLVLLGAFLRSIADLFLKAAVTNLPYWDAFALSRLGTVVPALAMLTLAGYRRQIVVPIRQWGYRLVAVAALIEIVVLVDLLLQTLAFALGPLGLVAATQSTLPLFVLGITVGVNRLRPGAIPAHGSGWPTWLVILLCFGIVAGVYLIQYGRG